MKSVIDGYLISQGAEEHEPLLIIKLPEDTKKHNLRQLVNGKLFSSDLNDYTMQPEDHLHYFMERGLPYQNLKIQAISSKIITRFSDILPIFLVRGRENEKAVRDEIEVSEFMHFEGAGDYVLISFAVYLSHHYYSYVRSSADLRWYCHNDSSVSHVSFKDLEKDLKKRAVLLFYVRDRIIDEPEIPGLLRFYAEEANKLQHLECFNKY